MEIEGALEFIRHNHRAVLGTHRADGRIQLSPVIAGVDEAGRIVISTRETAYKTRDLRRDPRAVLCVMNDGFFGDWLQVEGEAEVVSLPDALPLLVDYYRSIAGEHPDWDDYRAAMVRERRVIVRLPVTRAGPDRLG